ncbi:MAG: 23S rRNA (uracil(1939)-C(5))-methyltransferase, partial [Proteobacteria bacterium]|nr:23S rRNA (uracil(1939)-C(5))-methyltransferase [Pseudomonadota bacterium]
MTADGEPEVARIVDLSHDGYGVAKLGERPVFIPGALPGERVRLLPRRRRRQYQLGDLVEIIEPSESRVEPPCEYFGRCGGCAVQHLDYLAQVAFKESTLREALARIGAVKPETWLPPITGPEWNYRRKARLGVRYVKGKQRVLAGFKERATRYVTDMGSCMVLAKPFDRLPGPLGEVIGRTSLWRRLPQVELAAGKGVRAAVFRVLDDPEEADLKLFAEFGDRWNLDIYLQ